jgi:hypothetical protein
MAECMQNFRAVVGCLLDNSNLSLIVNKVLPPHSRIAPMIGLNNILDNQSKICDWLCAKATKKRPPEIAGSYACLYKLRDYVIDPALQQLRHTLQP